MAAGDLIGNDEAGAHRVIERLGSRLLIEDSAGERFVIKVWRTDRDPWRPVEA